MPVTLWASEAERDARWLEETSLEYDYRVYDIWDDGEFITHARVDLLVKGQVVETREFWGSTEDQYAAADGTGARQAISYAQAWVECMTIPLEERLAPFGLRWQQEM